MSGEGSCDGRDNREGVEGDGLAVMSGRIAFLRERLGKTIPIRRAAVLLTIALHPDITVGDLSRRLRMKPPSTCRDIDKLAGRGLVVRRKDYDNQRRTMLVLTPKGETFIGELLGHPPVNHGPFTSFEIKGPGRFTVTRMSRVSDQAG